MSGVVEAIKEISSLLHNLTDTIKLLEDAIRTTNTRVDMLEKELVKLKTTIGE